MQTRTSAIFTFAFTVLIGFVSGIVGGLWIADALLTPAAPSGVAFSVLRRPVVDSGDTVPGQVESAARAGATLFVKKTASADAVRAAYLPREAIAQGISLTADGWLMTWGGAFTFPKGTSFVVVVGGKLFDAALVARDPYTGVAFFKADAKELPVVPFGRADGLAYGERIYVADTGRGIHTAHLAALDDEPPASTDALLHSSEKIQAVLRTEAVSVSVGAAVFNKKGELVGLVSRVGTDALIAVPAEAFARQIPDALRMRSIPRPYFGVTFLDLSVPSAILTLDGEVARGALLHASLDGRQPAVRAGGPAAKAGLRAGDVILAIDDESVTLKNGLADILAGYNPGSKVVVTYRRGGQERTTEATLGEVP